VVDLASGTIVRVGDELPQGAEVLDLGDDVLMPGLVDSHVHLNEPGRTEWEGFETGTRAAAAGGVTTVVDMPLNSLPETTTVVALEAKRAAAAGKCWVDWRPWGGAVGSVMGGVAGNVGDLAGLAAGGVPGYKCFLIYPGCEGFGLIDEAELRRAMPEIARLELPLLVHAELAGPCLAAEEKLAGADWRRYATWLASRPDEAEVAAIRMMLRLAREFGCWVHVVHLATAEALGLLAEAKRDGVRVTVETCPHYLWFEADGIADGATLTKCAPPIRGAANRELLWQGLRDGVIEMVATDHSPCPVGMKGLEAGDFKKAWGGIASISLGLPVVWTEAARRGFGLEDVAEWMCGATARLAGLGGRKGRIAEGFDADLVAFAAEEEWVVGVEDLWFRHGVSPYVGAGLKGRVKQTYLRGELVFEGGLVGSARGMEVTG
jgi:allantoinase